MLNLISPWIMHSKIMDTYIQWLFIQLYLQHHFKTRQSNQIMKFYDEDLINSIPPKWNIRISRTFSQAQFTYVKLTTVIFGVDNQNGSKLIKCRMVFMFLCALTRIHSEHNSMPRDGNINSSLFCLKIHFFAMIRSKQQFWYTFRHLDKQAGLRRI